MLYAENILVVIRLQPTESPRSGRRRGLYGLRGCGLCGLRGRSCSTREVAVIPGRSARGRGSTRDFHPTRTKPYYVYFENSILDIFIKMLNEGFHE